MSTNPFSALVRMLELRIGRQKQALDESQSQLDAAIISRNLHDRESSAQVDAFSKNAKK